MQNIEIKPDPNLLIKYPYLRLRGLANQPGSTPAWTKENVISGLQKFYDENGRYPIASEIDIYKYLPTSRQIQRVFGGLIELRTSLGHEVQNYNAGVSRSHLSAVITKRGSEAERQFEMKLIDYFGEYFVHVEKLLYNHLPESFARRNKSRADFYVYAKDYRFCVDVFYAKDLASLQKIINIKQPKYAVVNIDVYLINLNESINLTDEALDRLKSRKKNLLPGHIYLMNGSRFLAFMKSQKPIKRL